MNLLVRAAALVTAAFVLLAAGARPTLAASYDVLSHGDATLYADAFAQVRDGDFKAVDDDLALVKDRSLVGHVALLKLMHPTAHKASYGELTAWLDDYGDLPGADRVYALALKRKPSGETAPQAPSFMAIVNLWNRVETVAGRVTGLAPSDKGLAARMAYYTGDLNKAMALAPAAGQRWVAGLAAYRLGRVSEARGWFEAVARDEGEDPWVRAGAAFWAARTAEETGDTEAVQPLLQLAASWPTTFYGMIAERKLAMSVNVAFLAPVSFLPAWVADCAGADPAAPRRLIKDDRRAHRAAGLAQLDRLIEAGLEVRAGMAVAKTDADRKAWVSLGAALNTPMTVAAEPAPAALASAARRPARRLVVEDYPTPDLFPEGGYTLDRALVYAMVRQESRFNPFAVSSAGAMGLMQVRPDAAAHAAGDDQLLANPLPLLDGPTNLRIGQDHFSWLMDKLVGYDLLRAIAAYNGGPGPVIKVRKALGDDADSLLLIESLPAPETREYVEHVTAAYWAYRRKFGSSTPTLDALASGARTVDIRLDR